MGPECGCPDAYPAWRDEDVDLGGQCIYRTPVPTFLHMPIAYELQVERQQRNLRQLGLRERWPGLAFIRTGMLGGSMIRLIEDASSLSRHVAHLPRPYWVRARLHEGGIGSLRQSVRDVQASLLDRGCMPKELWLAHLTCPRCAEPKGGEKILLLRHWKPSPRLRRGQADRG
jgi:hypothetical protein